MPALYETATVRPRSARVAIDAWFTRCPTASPFSIALHLGWIDAEFAGETCVQFRPLQTSADPKVHHAHYAHNHPNLFRHGGSYPAAWAQSNGADTRVIGLSWKHQANLILTLPDSRVRSARDLKGKRLFFLRRPKEDIDFGYATALRTYETALGSVGLNLADTKIVVQNIDRSLISDRVQPGNHDYVTFNKDPRKGRGSETIWALLNGEADAIVADARLVELLGLHVVFDSQSVPVSHQGNNGTPDTFAVNAELIDRHPDFVARVYARALQAVDWAQNNPGEALRFVALEQGKSESEALRAFGNNLLASLEINLLPERIEILDSNKAFLLQHGLLKRDFEVEKWIDRRPLKQARALLASRRLSSQYQAEIAPGAFRLPAVAARRSPVLVQS
jgi:ABC-type nitrate/sulfonate/bicarbonate transport system substrate-binding protein